MSGVISLDQRKTSSKRGSIADAVAKATGMKSKAAEVLGILGMPVPDRLKG